MALINLLCNELEFKTTHPNFSYLPGFLNEKFSDVTVTVSHLQFETKSYKLHRIVLAGCSSVLNQSLELHQTLDIPFMSPAEFELLIVFMYTGEMHFESVSELCFGLYAAKMYKWDNLVDYCSQRLLEKMKYDPGNAVLILQLDKRFHSRAENVAFFETVDKIIVTNYRKILCSEVIFKLEKETMRYLLEVNSISDVPEIEVFRTLVQWTKFCCGNSKDPEQLQEVAGDLIYCIRYNFIPIETMGLDVASSGLLSRDLLAQAFQRIYNDKLEVPFCTKSRRSINGIDALAKDLLDQEEWHLVSICSELEHSVHEVSRWSTNAILSWNGLKNVSEKWFYLPTVADSNFQWKVQLDCIQEDNFFVRVQCDSQDEQFRAISFRMFAFVEQNHQVWAEVADILESSVKNCSCHFSKKISDLSNVRPIKVRVRLTWTELDHLLPTPILSREDTAFMKCRWQLKGWKAITSTALYSEPFGRNGVLCRMVLKNNQNANDRIMELQLHWQHLPTSYEHSKLLLSISLGNRGLGETKVEVKWSSYCSWILKNSVNLELSEPLDLNVVIKPISDVQRTRRQMEQ